MSAGPRTAYARGAAFEREVARAFEAAGWIVMRSPRSAGAADLWAVRRVAKGEVAFIQCKKGGACGPEGWNTLWALARVHEAIPIIAARAARQPLKLWKITGAKVKRGRNPWVTWEIGGER